MAQIDPTKPLRDFRQEQFAQALARPMAPFEAYVAAGYAPDRKNAAKTAQRPNIAARVRHLMAPALHSAGVSRERVMKEVAALAFSDMRRVAKWGNIATDTGKETPDGVPIVTHFNDVAFLNSEDLTDEAAAAVSEVKRSAEGAISIKLHPKMPALKMLAELLRMMAPDDPDKRGVTLVQNVFNMTKAEAEDELAAAFRSARANAVDGNPAEDA